MPSSLRSKIHSGPVNRLSVSVAAIGTTHSGNDAPRNDCVLIESAESRIPARLLEDFAELTAEAGDDVAQVEDISFRLERDFVRTRSEIVAICLRGSTTTTRSTPFAKYSSVFACTSLVRSSGDNTSIATSGGPLTNPRRPAADGTRSFVRRRCQVLEQCRGSLPA